MGGDPKALPALSSRLSGRRAMVRVSTKTGEDMRKSVITRLIGVTASLMLVAFETLSSGVGTRRARAFSVLTVTNTADSGGAFRGMGSKQV